MPNEGLKIRAPLPKIRQLNKPLLLTVVAVVVIVIAVAIGLALHTGTPTQNKQNNDEQNVNIASVKADEDIIRNLPNSYQEISKIKAFQTQQVNQYMVPPEVQNELTTLKQEQGELQERLASAMKPQVNTGGNISPQTQQAKTSSVFFPGFTGEAVNTPATNTNPTNPNVFRAQDDYAKQNSQDQKKQFLEASDDISDIYDQHTMAIPISPYEVQAGTLIPAVLITGINTSLPGDVVSQVRQDIYDTVTGNFLLIPKGSKLLGTYDSQVSYGQRRVLIAYNRVIRPDGSSILLSKAGGADMLGRAGMEGDVDNHWMRVLGAATLSTILSVGAAMAAGTGTPNVYYPNAKQSALAGAASGISQVGQSISEKALNIQPTLTIPPNFLFNIIVQKDMILTPYQRKERIFVTPPKNP